VGRFLNRNALAAVNGHLASVDRRSSIRVKCWKGSDSKPVLSTRINQQVLKE
jgi:hypothetical protein